MLGSVTALNSSSARPIQSSTTPEVDPIKVSASVSGASKGAPETSDGIKPIEPSIETGTKSTQGDDQGDSLTLSQEAKNLAGETEKGEEAEEKAIVQDQEEADQVETEELTKKSATSEAEKVGNELSAAEKEQVEKLKQRDAEVKAHEQAHLAAAGGIANGGPKYDYQRGPDGKQYAIGGSVNISVSAEGSPQETIAKADQIIRSAQAPAEPSGKDRQIAAKARSLRVEAEQELRQENLEEATKPEKAKETSGLEEKDDSEEGGETSSLVKDNDSKEASGLNVGDAKKETGGLNVVEKPAETSGQAVVDNEDSDESPLEKNFGNNGVTYGFGNRTAGQISLNRISLTA